MCEVESANIDDANDDAGLVDGESGPQLPSCRLLACSQFGHRSRRGQRASGFDVRDFALIRIRPRTAHEGFDLARS